MERVNGRRSRTVLTAANESAIIAAVGREPYSLRSMAQKTEIVPTDCPRSTL
jgi:hypothetical protein